ncbi:MULTISPECIES: YfjI family protein [Enterobacterales]|uniref:YfjI family protein n=1 Tax=Enterobacterales TaxID=91347 RepID=UPI002227CEA4|nr:MULTISPECIES: YfjI family protein [Enterobacterales]MCW2481178.1 DUF3987 domain-containing protein [Candidatus Symbiopectobacterium sp. NZEC135]MDY4335684.1 YfjI family protein [Pectobacterium brasiliense]
MSLLDDPIDEEYPMHAFPKLIRDTLYEIQSITQAPCPLIGASILGAISLACQDSIDVCRLTNLRSPTSLFLMTIAESGERKSTVDKLLLNPLYQLEVKLYEEYTKAFREHNDILETIRNERKSLMMKIRSDIRHDRDPSISQKQLDSLLKKIPPDPIRYKLIFNDATPAAIKNYLCGKWGSIGIMSDEAGIVFSGYTLNELPFINKMWDGSILSIERKNAPEQLIQDARLTLALMVQPDVFKKYSTQKGDLAKGSGFFARCLICHPSSKQGHRQINNSVISKEHLTLFHKRLMDIVNKSLSRNNKDRVCLYFAPDAEKKWINFHNRIESEMAFMESLFDFKDYASKMTENMARIAALLHYFSNGEGDISLQTVESAISISIWYLKNHKKIFATNKKIEIFCAEHYILHQWIKKRCDNDRSLYIRKNIILQYGPNQFRNSNKTNELLRILYSKGMIEFYRRRNTVLVKPIDIVNETLNIDQLDCLTIE